MTPKIADLSNVRAVMGNAMGQPVATPALRDALAAHQPEVRARVADVLARKEGER